LQSKFIDKEIHRCPTEPRFIDLESERSPESAIRIEAKRSVFSRGSLSGLSLAPIETSSWASFRECSERSKKDLHSRFQQLIGKPTSVDHGQVDHTDTFFSEERSTLKTTIGAGCRIKTTHCPQKFGV
jgi:hypothetical protein